MQVENSGRNVPVSKILADHGLTQPICVEQELSNVLGPFARDEASLDKELYALKGYESKKFPTHDITHLLRFLIKPFNTLH